MLYSIVHTNSCLGLFVLQFRPVFKLQLSHPQLLLLLSIEVDLNIAEGNQWNKAVAEETYAESEEKDYNSENRVVYDTSH